VLVLGGFGYPDVLATLFTGPHRNLFLEERVHTLSRAREDASGCNASVVSYRKGWQYTLRQEYPLRVWQLAKRNALRLERGVASKVKGLI